MYVIGCYNLKLFKCACCILQVIDYILKADSKNKMNSTWLLDSPNTTLKPVNIDYERDGNYV